MQTTLRAYHFDTRIPDELAAWWELRQRLEATHPHCMESHGGGSHYLPWASHGATITLETEHIFNDQWNTAPIDGVTELGLRVFDWALDFEPNGSKHIKRGHYLDQTDEMREIRRNTVKCGYCGHQERAQKGNVFCPACLDSEYLKSDDLKLLRLVPVDEDVPSRQFPELTSVERDYLLPLYWQAQKQGATELGRARIAKARADVETKYARAIKSAEAERDGATWTLDKLPALEANRIYYSHTGRHCFGWRTPLEGELLSALLDAISEFPAHYEIRCADGRTLSN